MMTEEQTIKCPICGEPYTVYMYYAGDQSACPECRKKAKEKGDLYPKKNGKFRTFIRK